MTDAPAGVPQAPGRAPHRAGCPCSELAVRRCYPCTRHPSEILTHDQWQAMDDVYSSAGWSADSLVAAVKKSLRAARERDAAGELLGGSDDVAIGLDAMFEWLGVDPADLVVAVRHVELHEVSDCHPAYDDPECVAGTCRHLSCENDRAAAARRERQARIRVTPHVFTNTYLPADLLATGDVARIDQYPCMTRECGLPYSHPIHAGQSAQPGPSAVSGRAEGV